MSSIKDDSDKYLVSSEHLDQTLNIVTIKNWIGVTFFVLVTLCLILWSVMGEIPVTVSGKSVLLDPTSMAQVKSVYRSEVVNINVFSPSKVEKGDVIMTLKKLTDNNLGELQEVKAPITGTVYMIMHDIGALVEPGRDLFYMQKDLDPKNIKILGFVPFYQGQNIKPGMKTRASVADSSSTNKYGMINGYVKEVFPYIPDQESYYLQLIPSDAMIKFLVNSKLPVKMILIDPILDSSSSSGLSLTKSSALKAFKGGDLGMLQVELDYVKPISFLIPSKKIKEDL